MMNMYKSIGIFFLFFLVACSNSPVTKINQDTLSGKDSVKKALQEDLPPSSDIKQFNWLYSAFAQAAISGNDSLFNVFIHPTHGLWIIHSEGAMPAFTKVMKIEDFKVGRADGLMLFNRDAMLEVPKEEALPRVDCDAMDFYSKSGCFTQMQNSFAEEKIWKYAGLSADKDKEIGQLASTITRTVVNTKSFRFYFSLINGSWYLTFLDIRTPCNA